MVVLGLCGVCPIRPPPPEQYNTAERVRFSLNLYMKNMNKVTKPARKSTALVTGMSESTHKPARPGSGPGSAPGPAPAPAPVKQPTPVPDTPQPRPTPTPPTHEDPSVDEESEATSTPAHPHWWNKLGIDRKAS